MKNANLTSDIRPLTSAVKQLVIASHNAGKVKEIAELIVPLGIKALSATDAKVSEPEETGTTFAENAALKAEHALAASGLPSLADDSGLAVPSIGGAPGIYSARWAGPNKDFNVAFERIQECLLNPRRMAEGQESGDPGKSGPPLKAGVIDAYFICVLALAVPGGKTRTFEGRVDGRLIFPPRGKLGFGYDPIFIPQGYEITFGEMDPVEKNRISHRARAFKKFLDYLEKRA